MSPKCKKYKDVFAAPASDLFKALEERESGKTEALRKEAANKAEALYKTALNEARKYF